MKTIKISLYIFLLSIISNNATATSYTWNGSTNSFWNVSSNWTPNGIPGSSDNVTIVTATYSVDLDTVRSITAFTMTSGTLSLSRYNLTINGNATFNGGTISGSDGKLLPRGSVTNFHGTTFNCKVDAISGQIKMNGGTFNDSLIVDQSGTSSTTGDGGGTFNKPVIIKKTGSSYLKLGNLYPDIFNANVIVYNTGNNQIQFSYGAAGTKFRGNIVLNNTGIADGVTFGSNEGTTTLDSGKTLTIGSNDFTDATLLLKNFHQQ